MPVIICKTHGSSFCYSVCPHIIENKQNGQKPQKILTMSFYFGDFAGNKGAPMTFPFNYCEKCIELYNFPKEDYQFSEENLPIEEFDKKFDFVSDIFQLVCCNCYEKFMNEGKNFYS
jgi:hypothetical protein